MTHGLHVLWLLRIYGPCSVAELLRHTEMDRFTLVGALYRERKKGTAERCMRATYRLTDDGRATLEARPKADGVTKEKMLF